MSDIPDRIIHDLQEFIKKISRGDLVECSRIEYHDGEHKMIRGVLDENLEFQAFDNQQL